MIKHYKNVRSITIPVPWGCTAPGSRNTSCQTYEEGRELAQPWHGESCPGRTWRSLASTALCEASAGTHLLSLCHDSWRFLCLNEAPSFAAPSASVPRQLFILPVPKLSLQAGLKYWSLITGPATNACYAIRETPNVIQAECCMKWKGKEYTIRIW